MDKIILTEHQQEAFDKIINIFEKATSNTAKKIMDMSSSVNVRKKMIAFSGPAGSGKTTMTAELMKYIKTRSTITATSPTHKASRVLRNMCHNAGLDVKVSTIHSFLNLKVKIDYNNGKEILTIDNSKPPKTIDILFLDEGSMVNEELMKHIDEAIKRNRVKFVIFVGDVIQLPPVGEIKSKVFDIPNQVHLTKVCRQAEGSGILRIVTAIRRFIEEDRYPETHKFKQWLRKVSKDMEDVHEYMEEDDFLQAYFDNDFVGENEQLICSFENSDVDSYSELIRMCYKGDDIDRVVEGDRLIFQKPNIDKDDEMVHSNNEEILVASVEDDTKEIEEGLEINYHIVTDYDEGDNKPRICKVVADSSMNDWYSYLDEISEDAKNASGKEKRALWEKYFTMREVFNDVKYAYACTAHKSQGSNYKNVYVDVRRILKALSYKGTKPEFVYRLVYVALSRASKKLFMLV